VPGHSTRKDAVRNRKAVLAAADALFDRCESPEDVTMADVAAAAGVGKGTLFRAFGDRNGLLLALYEARVEPVREAVESGPPPLGPATPPLERVPALLDAVLCFKLDNRPLALALEETGSSSPYQAAHYERWHDLLQAMLEQIPAWMTAISPPTPCSPPRAPTSSSTWPDTSEYRAKECGRNWRASRPESWAVEAPR
jgi:AcrR family transcriptional regulator